MCATNHVHNVCVPGSSNDAGARDDGITFVLVVHIYILHNKARILALALEGRVTQDGLCSLSLSLCGSWIITG